MERLLNELRNLENVEGRPVLIQANINVPIDENGKIVNEQPILDVIPCIEVLKEKSAKILIAANFAKDEKEADYPLEPVIIRLSELLNEEVIYLSLYKGEELNRKIRELNNGQVGVLKNINARIKK